MKRRVLGTISGVLLTLMGLMVPATLQVDAACLAPRPGFDPVAHARVAFLGTVASSTNDQQQALVRVESVWRGPQLPAEVAVESSVLPPPGVGIEDLAIFIPGTRYLFLPENTGQPFKFGGCGGPTEYTSALDRYRPGTAHSPLSASTVGDAVEIAWFTATTHLFLTVVLVLLALTGVVMALRSRRKRRATAAAHHDGAA